MRVVVLAHKLKTNVYMILCQRSLVVCILLLLSAVTHVNASLKFMCARPIIIFITTIIIIV